VADGLTLYQPNHQETDMAEHKFETIVTPKPDKQPPSSFKPAESTLTVLAGTDVENVDGSAILEILIKIQSGLFLTVWRRLGRSMGW
jgi:hypothetical protein